MGMFDYADQSVNQHVQFFVFTKFSHSFSFLQFFSTGVAGVLQQVLDMVRGQNAEDEAAGPHDNPGGGDGDGGEGLHGFQAGDFIADDDFEFD